MITWTEVNRNLSSINSNYLLLREKFVKFAIVFESQLKEPNIKVKGISTELFLDKNYFNVSFAGKEIRFEFRTCINDGGLAGMVVCYLEPDFPKTEPICLNTINFSSTGRTDLRDASDGDILNITYDTSAVYIIFNILNDAFSGYLSY